MIAVVSTKIILLRLIDAFIHSSTECVCITSCPYKKILIKTSLRKTELQINFNINRKRRIVQIKEDDSTTNDMHINAVKMALIK